MYNPIVIGKSLEAARFVHRALILACAALLVISIGGDKSDIKSMRRELKFIASFPEFCRKNKKDITEIRQRITRNILMATALQYAAAFEPARSIRASIRYEGRLSIPADFRCPKSKDLQTIPDAVRWTRNVIHVPIYTDSKRVFIQHRGKSEKIPLHVTADHAKLERRRVLAKRFCGLEPRFCANKKFRPSARITVSAYDLSIRMLRDGEKSTRFFRPPLMDSFLYAESPYIWPGDSRHLYNLKGFPNVLRKQGGLYVWYPGLTEFMGRVGIEDLKEVRTVVDKAMLEAGKTPIELFGLKFSQRILESVSPLLILSVMLYLLLHVTQAAARVSAGDAWGDPVAWFPIYRSWQARTAALLSLTYLPAAALLALAFHDVAFADIEDLLENGLIVSFLADKIGMLLSACLTFGLGAYLYIQIEGKLTIRGRAFMNAWKPLPFVLKAGSESDSLNDQ